ncbi:MAG TPA: hypothetical protein VFB22_04250 [Candidatus Baltobacteraceae bacterium]|nr:hypothetical protein [Candidatus Baltobacteraceae bacterium]
MPYMSAETLTAIASVATTIVIAATAVAAIVQLRHMRAGNAMEATLSFRAMLEDEAHREAADLLRGGEVGRALQDPAFREYLYRTTRKLPLENPPPARYVQLNHAAIAMGNSFEMIGGMVRNRIVPTNIFLPNYWWVVTNHWSNLETYVALMREYSGSPGMFEDFEYLTVLSRKWAKDHPESYARGVPRIALKNAYPLSGESWFSDTHTGG